MKYLILLLMLLPACVHNIRPYTGTDIRAIKVVVLTNDTWDDAEIMQGISEASQDMTTYAGLRLEVVKVLHHPFEKMKIEIPEGSWSNAHIDLNRAIQYLDKVMLDDEYDIAVAYQGGYAVDGLKFFVTFFTGIPLKIIQGMTDDVDRRYILMLSPDSQILEHEIAHTLLAQHDCMSGIAIPPFKMIDTGMGCIDRYRDFKKPWNYGQDIIFGEIQ